MNLLALVEHYAALAVDRKATHRTGTEVDSATADWLAHELSTLGFEAQVHSAPFPQWMASSQLSADGEQLDHLPVFYECDGSVDTTAPDIISLDPLFGGFAAVLDAPIAASIAAGADALIVATKHPDGHLVAINRVPGTRSGHPTVLVAGADFDRLRAASEVRLVLSSQQAEGQMSEVIATNGPARDGATPLVISTPTSGWFTCAGERATGIAVLLDTVDRLGRSHPDLPVLIVATSGHEIDLLGARHWVAGQLERGTDVLGVVHIGASIAVEEDTPEGRQLASTRMAKTNLSAVAAASMASALQPANLNLEAPTGSWVGESEVFSQLAVPMLSLSGAGRDFHTPNDTPARATSAAALALAADAVYDAVVEFVSVLSNTSAVS